MKALATLAVVLGLALAAVPVHAQQNSGPHGRHGGQARADAGTAPKAGMMQGRGPGMMQMVPGKHIEGRLAFLRAEIGITEAQAPAWNGFADAVRKSAKDRGASMPMMHARESKADWLETTERHEKMMAAHLESLRAIRAAAQPLFGALSDDQKRIANELMAGPMGPMGGMGHRMRM